MKNYKLVIILLNLGLLLAFFTNAVLKKEATLKSGKFILLELAPVDPRSLMQGDYMQLRYKISRDVKFDSIAKRGYCIVSLDDSSRANLVRYQANKEPITKNEIPIKYFSRDNWSINIGAESYFFQEGQSEKYGTAKYGGIKIDADGNSLLVGLYDAVLKKL